MSAFKQYVTGAAFCLNLSKTQIEALGRVYAACGMLDERSRAELSWVSDAFYQCQRKGLLCEKDGTWGLTKEGCLVVTLLQQAELLRILPVSVRRHAA